MSLPREITELRKRILGKAVELNVRWPIPKITEGSSEGKGTAVTGGIQRDAYLNLVHSTKPADKIWRYNALQHKELGAYIVDEMLKLVPASTADVETKALARAVYNKMHEDEVPPFGVYQRNLIVLPGKETGLFIGKWGMLSFKQRRKAIALVNTVSRILVDLKVSIDNKVAEENQIAAEQRFHLTIYAVHNLRDLNYKLCQKLGIYSKAT
ncbi:TPA: hypothetical protein HA244_06465 [Candidatus Micrarchaeota archaeon]|nr:hypothetical protein [Candidatus Micrarchaeota archaeon]